MISLSSVVVVSVAGKLILILGYKLYRKGNKTRNERIMERSCCGLVHDKRISKSKKKHRKHISWNSRLPVEVLHNQSFDEVIDSCVQNDPLSDKTNDCNERVEFIENVIAQFKKIVDPKAATTNAPKSPRQCDNLISFDESGDNPNFSNDSSKKEIKGSKQTNKTKSIKTKKALLREKELSHKNHLKEQKGIFFVEEAVIEKVCVVETIETELCEVESCENQLAKEVELVQTENIFEKDDCSEMIKPAEESHIDAKNISAEDAETSKKKTSIKTPKSCSNKWKRTKQRSSNHSPDKSLNCQKQDKCVQTLSPLKSILHNGKSFRSKIPTPIKRGTKRSSSLPRKLKSDSESKLVNSERQPDTIKAKIVKYPSYESLCLLDLNKVSDSLIDPAQFKTNSFGGYITEMLNTCNEYASSGDFARAEKTCFWVLDILQKGPTKENQLRIIRGLKVLAQIYIKQERFDDAVNILELLVEKIREYHGESSAVLLPVLASLTHCCNKTADLNKVDFYNKKCNEIRNLAQLKQI